MVDVHHTVHRNAATDSPTSVLAERRHDLDALRGFAMLLGIALHAAIPFVPYATDNNSGARLNSLFFEYVHGFRMPVFFILSGYFTTMLWKRRQTRGLLRHRARRIGLPLVMGAITIVPLVRLAFAGAHRLVGSEGPAHPIGLSHLWFLWFLVIMVAGFAAVASGTAKLKEHVPGFGRLEAKAATSSLLLLPVLTFVAASRMVEPIFGPDYSDTIIPNDGVLAYYISFFAFGAVIFGRTDGTGDLTLDALGRRWVALLTISSAVLFPLGNVFMERSPTTSALVQVGFAWAMSFGLLGAFSTLAARPSPALTWLSDASYWMYLIHLPIVIVAQALASRAGLPPLMAAPLIFTVTTPLLMLSYEHFVRYTPIGTALNGPRSR